MNMILAELIMALYGIPIDFTSSLLHGWKMGRHMCYATGFLLTLSGSKINRSLLMFQLNKFKFDVLSILRNNIEKLDVILHYRYGFYPNTDGNLDS